MAFYSYSSSIHIHIHPVRDLTRDILGAGIQVVEVSCGNWQSAAVTAEGKVFTWGANADDFGPPEQDVETSTTFYLDECNEEGRQKGKWRLMSLGHGDNEAQSMPKMVQAL